MFVLRTWHVTRFPQTLKWKHHKKIHNYSKTNYKQNIINEHLGHVYYLNTRHKCKINASSSQSPNSTVLVEYEVDEELWEALEMCNDEELKLLHFILFSPSPFSPAVKNIIMQSTNNSNVQSRESLMKDIETRFRFLAADSLETLRGEHPSYRETLTHIQKKFGINCSKNLDTQDIESEIFLYLFENRVETSASTKNINYMFLDGDGMTSSSSSLYPSNKFKIFNKILSPLRYGKNELASLLTKFSGALTVSTIRDLCLRKTGAVMVMSNIKYQLALKAIYDNGINSAKKEAAIQAAQSSMMNNAMRCGSVNGALSLLGPIMWTLFGLDLLMKSLGTDYARVVKAVFSLGQIRLLKTYGFTKPKV